MSNNKRKLTKKEYEEDIIYLFNILKENSPYSFLFDFEKFKNKILKSNILDKFINNADFYLFLLKFFNEIINKDNGHIFFLLPNKNDIPEKICNPNIYKNLYLFYKKYLNKCYTEEELDEDLKTSFLNFDFINDKKNINKKINKINKNNKNNNNKNNNFVEIDYFKYGIIKDDNNKNVIYLKLNKFFQNTNNSDYILLLNSILGFIYKNRNLNDLYIDLRGNSGGNIILCYQLLDIIYKGSLKPRFNNTKLYYKYTKYNKDYIDDALNLCKDIKIKELKNNKNFTHYIIQKEKK